jgi:hypothetical protein
MITASIGDPLCYVYFITKKIKMVYNLELVLVINQRWQHMIDENKVTCYKLNEQDSFHCSGGIFLFASASRLVLMPTQPHIQ